MPPRYDLPKAAPGGLRLVQELVNTSDLEHGREWLPTVEALRGWLGERELPGATDAGEADLERTRLLRTSLRALLVANAGEGLDDEAVPSLNRLAERAAVVLRFSADGSARFEALGSGVSATHARIVLAVQEAMAAGTWSRLKACRQCSWAYYDYSKNRSATWCSMQICGNRRKTRAYRARRRTA